MCLVGFSCLSSLVIIEALKCVRMIVWIFKLDFVQKIVSGNSSLKSMKDTTITCIY